MSPRVLATHTRALLASLRDAGYTSAAILLELRTLEAHGGDFVEARLTGSQHGTLYSGEAFDVSASGGWEEAFSTWRRQFLRPRSGA